jgi:hypothetical protein
MFWESPYTMLVIGMLCIAFFVWRSDNDSAITTIRRWALLAMGIMLLISAISRIFF